MKKIISAQGIKDLIPQRPPILMIDGVTEYEPGKSITTTKWVGTEDGAFNGHFPGFPLFPGVLLIEAAAQTGAVIMQLDELNWSPGDDFTKDPNAPETMGVLGGSKIRFKKPLFPETQLFVQGTVEWFMKGSMSLKVKATNGKGDVLMSGAVTLSTILKSQLKGTKNGQLTEAV